MIIVAMILIAATSEARPARPDWLSRPPEATRDTMVERIFRDVRAFRIYDGPSEVHRWSLAQRIMRHGANW